MLPRLQPQNQNTFALKIYSQIPYATSIAQVRLRLLLLRANKLLPPPNWMLKTFFSTKNLCKTFGVDKLKVLKKKKYKLMHPVRICFNYVTGG